MSRASSQTRPGAHRFSGTAGTLPRPCGNTRAVCAKFVIDASAAECLHFSTDHLRGVEVQVGGEHGRSPLTAPRRRVQGPASRPVPRSDS